MKLKALEVIRPFRVGDRVRLSAVGRARKPRKTRRAGVVVGFSENEIVVRVVFDGQKTPSQLHASFLELVSGSIPVMGTTTERLIELLKAIESDHDLVGDIAPGC